MKNELRSDRDAVSIKNIVQLFNALIYQEVDAPLTSACNIPSLERALELAEAMVEYTCNSYDQNCVVYKELRTETLHDFEKKVWDILISYIKKYIPRIPETIRLLDVGAANGRDVLYSTSQGYETYGCDNSSGFIKLLHSLEESGALRANSIKQCDMRALDYPDEFFDVVRHHASLIHMPMVTKGYMLDKAISEAYRVLKPGGLLFVLVKSGSGLKLVDTQEGLGDRIFQYHTHQTINEVISRNGFTIIQTTDETSRRSIDSSWICLVGRKWL